MRKVSFKQVLFYAGIAAAVFCPFMAPADTGATAIATGLAALAFLKASEMLPTKSSVD